MLDATDRAAMADVSALKRAYRPKQKKIKPPKIGQPQKEKPLDLLRILNIVH